MGRRDIVPNINFFMRVPVQDTGRGQIRLDKGQAQRDVDALLKGRQI